MRLAVDIKQQFVNQQDDKLIDDRKRVEAAQDIAVKLRVLEPQAGHFLSGLEPPNRRLAGELRAGSANHSKLAPLRRKGDGEGRHPDGGPNFTSASELPVEGVTDGKRESAAGERPDVGVEARGRNAVSSNESRGASPVPSIIWRSFCSAAFEEPPGAEGKHGGASGAGGSASAAWPWASCASELMERVLQGCGVSALPSTGPRASWHSLPVLVVNLAPSSPPHRLADDGRVETTLLHPKVGSAFTRSQWSFVVSCLANFSCSKEISILMLAPISSEEPKVQAEGEKILGW